MCSYSSASSKGQQEVTIAAGLPEYCFDGLSPDALYTATVFVQTSNLEGPGVSTDERTCECCMFLSCSWILNICVEMTKLICEQRRVFTKQPDL